MKTVRLPMNALRPKDVPEDATVLVYRDGQVIDTVVFRNLYWVALSDLSGDLEEYLYDFLCLYESARSTQNTQNTQLSYLCVYADKQKRNESVIIEQDVVYVEDVALTDILHVYTSDRLVGMVYYKDGYWHKLTEGTGLRSEDSLLDLLMPSKEDGVNLAMTFKLIEDEDITDNEVHKTD